MIRKKLIKRTVILDLDGTLVNVDCFKLFLIKILMYSPSRWIYIPLLIINVIFFLISEMENLTRIQYKNHLIYDFEVYIKLKNEIILK